MLLKSMIGSIALATAVIGGPAAAQQPFDQTNIRHWRANGKESGRSASSIRPSRRRADSKAPLTPEYQAIFEANLAEVAKGGFGGRPVYTCIPEGMPRAMNLVLPMEIVHHANTTYILMEIPEHASPHLYGRAQLSDRRGSLMDGILVGKWIDEDGSGRYSVFEVETRNLKNPRTFDPSGVLLHRDGQTVIKERFYLDKANPDILHDEITRSGPRTHAPLDGREDMKRERKPIWVESICGEGNVHVNIANQHYMLNATASSCPPRRTSRRPT